MRVVLYEFLNNISQNLIGPTLRTAGKKLYQIGNNIEGQLVSEDRLTPSLRKLTYQGKQPQLQQTNFVAPNATILGDVAVGRNSSIWYGATLIGTSPIRVGNNSILQDRVHVSKGTKIGSNVFVGPNVILQGSKLQDNSYVAMGATVRHATVHSGGFVAAGAVVVDGSEVKEGEIWAGNPARFLRGVTPLERQVLKEHLEQMHELAVIHSQETEKTTREVLNGPNFRQDQSANIEEYIKNMGEGGYAYTEDDYEFLEQRLLLNEKLLMPEWGQDYEPYRFENKHIGQKFKVGIHEEEFAEVALKLKHKQEFKDRKPWDHAY